MTNQDYESQFGDSELGEMMHAAYKSRKEYYREYVYEDYQFEHIAEISLKVAMVLLNEAPVAPILREIWEVQRDETKTIVSLMNKGAVRVDTPTYMGTERGQIWVYNHDGKYSLCRPSKKGQ